MLVSVCLSVCLYKYVQLSLLTLVCVLQGHIPACRLKLLLRTLEQQQYYTPNEKDGVRVRDYCLAHTHEFISMLLTGEGPVQTDRELSVAVGNGRGAEERELCPLQIHLYSTIIRW